MTAVPACPARCSAPSSPAFVVGTFDVFRCGGCGLYLLHREPDGAAPALDLDRTQFDEAFRDLRVGNYRRILDDVSSRVALGGARVLDVGSSTGWFLETAVERGCLCFGIEPDPFFCERARRSMPVGIEVVEGYFPRDVPREWEPFDIITFHDVFEHLEDPRAILEACRGRLTDRGLVVLSLPSAHGFVYRLGTLFYRLGWKSPLERMFQVNYPFPHLFYFTPESIGSLVAAAGFEVVTSGRIDGFAVRGSLHRARLDEPRDATGTAGQYATALGLAGIALVQRAMPPDNIYLILRPRRV